MDRTEGRMYLMLTNPCEDSYAYWNKTNLLQVLFENQRLHEKFIIKNCS